MGNGSTTKIQQKTLPYDFLANLIPLYNSNLSKVSIVKWSQKWIFVDGNAFFGLPFDLKNTLKTAILQIFGDARAGTSGHKNPFLRPLYNRYFCHITIVKWSQIYKKIHQKVFF